MYDNSASIFSIHGWLTMTINDLIFASLDDNMTFANFSFDNIEQKFATSSLNFKDITRVKFDILLSNETTLFFIDVLYRVEVQDVKKLFIKKLHDFRKCNPDDSFYKIIFGIGGMHFEVGAEEEALKNGIGIIKIVGDKVEYNTEGIQIY